MSLEFWDTPAGFVRVSGALTPLPES
jgi:hypothetical protein